MAIWTIMTSKQLSSCASCGHQIAPGALVFGCAEKLRWFHLECAASGAPKVFPPFAKEAGRLLEHAKPNETREVPAGELARALATPGDEALDVIADLLQSRGDPWGELIALRRRGEHELADEHLGANQASLFGGLLRKEVSWRDGVITFARFSGKAPVLVNALNRVTAARTAGRLEHLSLSGAIDVSVLQLLNTTAPNLERLELSGLASGFEALDLPRLRSLRLSLGSGAAPALGGLLEAKVPNLRALRLTTHRPVSVSFLGDLLTSQLLTQLEWLDFEDRSNLVRTLDDAGLRCLLAGQKKLKHVKAMWVERAGRSLTPEELTGAHAFFEVRGKRALARQRKEDVELEDEVG